MARVYSCDGCGSPMATPDTVLGHVYKREYCSACAVHASAYLARLESERADLVAQFAVRRDGLREEFLRQIVKLPDMPEAA